MGFHKDNPFPVAEEVLGTVSHSAQSSLYFIVELRYFDYVVQRNCEQPTSDQEQSELHKFESNARWLSSAHVPSIDRIANVTIITDLYPLREMYAVTTLLCIKSTRIIVSSGTIPIIDVPLPEHFLSTYRCRWQMVLPGWEDRLRMRIFFFKCAGMNLSRSAGMNGAFEWRETSA